MGNMQSSGGSRHLSKSDLDRMERRLRRLGRGNAEVTLSDLRSVPELSTNAAIPRLFELFDVDGDGYLNIHDLRNLIETIMTVSTDDAAREEFAFRIYDHDGDGFVTPDDLFARFTDSEGAPRASLATPRLAALLAEAEGGAPGAAGAITASERERVADAARCLVSKHDADCDGRLNQLEFQDMVRVACGGPGGAGGGAGGGRGSRFRASVAGGVGKSVSFMP